MQERERGERRGRGEGAGTTGGGEALRGERWLLPAGVEEVLPPDARRIEHMRRRLVDLFESWGYELVMPPFLEYLESLLSGPGADVELQTFKVIDQYSGRLMGVRADMTPQVARMDARHLASRRSPVRLCYLGTVLHARPDPFFGSRSPLQVGAELYGHAGIESDVEVIALMLAMLERAGLADVHLDVGHFGLYRGLVGGLGLSEAEEARLFEALQRKARDDVELALRSASVPLPAHEVERVVALTGLAGGREVLGRARAVIGRDGLGLSSAVDDLERLADALEARGLGVALHFDLAELRGYRYHGGMVFSAFVPGFGREVARGGRYDQNEKVFGRARAATGFSADLRLLLGLAPAPAAVPRGGVCAPAGSDPALLGHIARLRARGERVVEMLPGQRGGAAELGCDRVLEKGDDGWQVVTAPPGTG